MRFLIKSMSIFLFASIVILAGCNNIGIDKESRESEVAAALHGESKSWKATVTTGVRDGMFVSKTEIKPLHKVNISSLTITTVFEDERYGQHDVTITNREMLKQSVIGDRDFWPSGTVDAKATKDKVKTEVKLARVEIQWVYQGETKKENVIVQTQ